MALPDLTPPSKTSLVVLPSSGNTANVDKPLNQLPFGIYTSSLWDTWQIDIYREGSAKQVSYVYKKLGGDVLDLEITEYQVYAAYEEACLEYSYLVNIHQGKNVLSNILGASTGRFDSDGELIDTTENSSISGIYDGNNYVQPGTNVSLKYPRFDFAYARRVAEGISEEVGIGGSLTIHLASFDIENSKQDYNLQEIISDNPKYKTVVNQNGELVTAATEVELFRETVDDTDPDNLVHVKFTKNDKIQIKKVYYKTPKAMWHYYGMHGGTNVVGNFQNYGGYSNATYFQVPPVWDTKQTMQHFEDRLYNRYSHHSFELKNNNLRLFPIPTSTHPQKMWIEFSVGIDNWEREADSEVNIGLDGINNLNSAPFSNIPYDKINAIGKQWIRRFALALCKEMLGMSRSKFGSIPIPGNDIQLNGSDLISQAKEEQAALRDELKEVLDELTYGNMIEGDAKMLDSTLEVQKHIPIPIYVG